MVENMEAPRASSRRKPRLLGITVLALFLSFETLSFLPAVIQPLSSAPASGSGGCLYLNANPPDISDEEAFRGGVKRWIDICREAFAWGDPDPRIKVSLAGALGADGKRDDAVTLLRAAAAQNDAQALYLLYEEHKSFGRSIDRPQAVSRAEAEQSLRRAAELGHPEATHTLAVLFDRGGVVKRDPAGARFWAERALVNPPKHWHPIDIQVLRGRLLAQSDQPEERARGLDLLETLARGGRGDAKAYLAIAIRTESPTRARGLLEESLRSYPGHAVPTLAQMLIDGEGGAKDERRAVSLLRSVPDVGAVSKAVELFRHEAQWSVDARNKTMQLLAVHPDIPLPHSGTFLYAAIEAAELGEAGALSALVDLKLSSNLQFRDQDGACALLKEYGNRELTQPCR
jgi:TPR repeat protein